MKKNPKQRTYSYFVTLSPKDKEFVATFLELEGLSGLAPTVHGAIRELDQALDAWVTAVSEDELPDAVFPFPMVIIDRSFLGDKPLLSELTATLPEELQPPESLPPVQNTYSQGESRTIKTVRFSKDKPVVQF